MSEIGNSGPPIHYHGHLLQYLRYRLFRCVYIYILTAKPSEISLPEGVIHCGKSSFHPYSCENDVVKTSQPTDCFWARAGPIASSLKQSYTPPHLHPHVPPDTRYETPPDYIPMFSPSKQHTMRHTAERVTFAPFSGVQWAGFTAIKAPVPPPQRSILFH